MGTTAYNECMRRHYETFVSEDDFRRMADRSQCRCVCRFLVCLWFAGVRCVLHLGCRLHRPCN